MLRKDSFIEFMLNQTVDAPAPSVMAKPIKVLQPAYATMAAAINTDEFKQKIESHMQQDASLSYRDAAKKVFDIIADYDQRKTVALALFEKETDLQRKVALVNAIKTKTIEYSIPTNMFMFKYNNPELFQS